MTRNEWFSGITTVIVAAALIFPGTVFGQEPGPVLVRSEMPGWPQWRGPNFDGSTPAAATAILS